MNNKAKLEQKIMEVMKQVRYLSKDDHVSVGRGNGYKALSAEKVDVAVSEALIKAGLTFKTHKIISKDAIERIVGGEVKGYLLTVHAQYKITDTETGEYELVESIGSGVDTQDKSAGKAMTYAKKYALLQTFQIPTGEDPDKVSSEAWDKQFEGEQTPSQQLAQTNEAEQNGPTTERQIKQFFGKLNELAKLRNTDKNKLRDYIYQQIKVKKIDDATAKIADKILNSMQAEIDKLKQSQPEELFDPFDV